MQTQLGSRFCALNATSSKMRLFALVLFVVCTTAGADAADRNHQVRVVRSNEAELILDVRSDAVLSEVTHDNNTYVRPASERLRLMQWQGRRRYVRSYDVIVPGPNGFSLEGAQFRTKEVSPGQSSKEPLTPLVPTATCNDRICLTYEGIATDRHVARLDVVVAEETATGFSMLTTADIRIRFDSKGAQPGRPSSNAPLLALNPSVSWTASVAVGNLRSFKVSGDEVQAETQPVMYRLRISREGVYRITSDQLRSAGIATDAAAATSIKVFGGGGRELPESVDSALANQLREQPIIVQTNGDGSIREVVFYASGSTGWVQSGTQISHRINHYSNEAGYYLAVGGQPGLRAAARPVPNEEPTIKPTTTVGRVFSEEEIVNPLPPGSGRRWLGRTIENRSSIVVTMPLPGLVPTGNILYRYVVGHRSRSSNGVISVTESGATVSQVSLPPVPEYMDVYTNSGFGTIAASRIPADGRTALRFSYQSNDNSSTGLIDWVEVHYPQSLDAQSNTYTFWTQTDAAVQEYSVNGFSGTVYAFDVTDPSRPAMVGNAASVGGMFAVRERIASGQARRFFLTAELSSIGSLERVNVPSFAESDRAADVLVIAHPDLLESANQFAQYRRGRGKCSVSVFTTEEIYARFSYGMLDPTAVRDFLANAIARWTPRPSHVVLWGDGHYDYKNISTTQKNFILPYESLDPDNADIGLTTTSTDDYFVRVVGTDRRPDLASGRVPIRSNAEGRTFIAKIRRYETESSRDDWRTRITLLADDGEKEDRKSDGSTHLDQNEELISEYVPVEFQPRKIYMVEYPTENIARGRRKPSVTQELVSTVNTTGSVLLNYIGHGNPRVWAHEQVFVRETTPKELLNSNKFFFLTAATCDFARFDLTDIQSGAEELLLMPDGGAIGVFSAARVVYSLANAALNQEFYADLFTRMPDGTYPTIGQAMYRVKQAFNGGNDEKFLILGDPTLTLLVPDHGVRFTAINGADIEGDSSAVNVAALSTVQVSGVVSRPLSKEADESFNGNITVSLTDAARMVTVIDDDVYKSRNVFRRPGSALCRGSFKVEKGRFTATFVVPKDISFSRDLASLYGYAASDDDRFAMGATNRVVVDGVTDVRDPEADGPEIKVFVDSRKFVPGGIVRPNPVLIVDLADETGINTTGVGIGHDITAQFNNASGIEILTPTFTTSLENPRAGTAQKQIFGLGPGMHTVTVQAWDVYNNVSSHSTMFRIPDGGDAIIAEGLFNFPNPFSSSTTIRFTHASQRPFSATLLIYDLQGTLLLERPMSISDMQTADIVWDGRDESGDMAQSGMYQAVVRLMDADGTTSFVSGKLTLIR
ncbi:MAG: type IX secretion system sortase PorU [Candidatus Kapabacteria bacterium]|nr:type IX secretion system sortase PorU [Candidatus Kapabacteria bacterium]